MPQSQRLSSVIPFVTIERPACPKCKAAMMLASIVPAHAGVDFHTFECAICNHELKTLVAYEDPMKSRGLGRWLRFRTPEALDGPREADSPHAI